MERVFREQLVRELVRREYVAPVVVDVFRRDDAMPLDLLLAVLDAKELAGRVPGSCLIGERKGQRLGIEHVPAEDVAIVRLGTRGAFGNLVFLVAIDRGGEALEGAIAVHVLDRHAGRYGLARSMPSLIAVLEEHEA